MVIDLFQFLADRTTFFKKPLWKFWYNLAAKIDGEGSDLKFMNFGYAASSNEGRTIKLDQNDEKHRYCIQLYHKTIENVQVKDKHLLEMSCGRGGGASAIMLYMKPASLTGIDLSSEAITINKRLSTTPNLLFKEGSAERIQTDHDSIDVVLNIEASHCYPYIQKFFLEVKRILKPGGYFCYADFRKVQDIPSWKKQIHNSGLVLLKEEDITDNVVRALEFDSRRKIELINRRAPKPLKGVFKKFSCVENSPNFKSLKEKKWRYLRFLLQKPASGEQALGLFEP